jgi:hypothetical protein
LQEVVTDKGYHSDDSLQMMAAMEVRSYIPADSAKDAFDHSVCRHSVEGGFANPKARGRLDSTDPDARAGVVHSGGHGG